MTSSAGNEDRPPFGRAVPPPPRRSTKHPLLIVDDEADVLASLRSMFRRDYKILTAGRGEEAFEILQQEEVHVVLSDQRMPGMGGAELLAKIAQTYPDVVRLMMTGYTDIGSVVDAINLGHVYRYISKPWDPKEMETVVRQAVDKFELVAERNRLVKELQEANQLKTAFITVASHELNTPLTIVMGMLQLAQSKGSDPNANDYLQRSFKAAERLHKRLTNTFKLLQEKDFRKSLDRDVLRVADLFADARQDLEPFLTMRKQALVSRVEPPDLEVRASRSHLRDILENLLTNAIKFSPDGATIEIAGCREGDQVRFDVIDHGVGISREDQPHVFEPLFSTWDSMRHSTGDYGFCKRGMGLGLAIARKFVEMHGGAIRFQTGAEGTRFEVRLPAE